jgi:CheY-like chemotaxis protein
MGHAPSRAADTTADGEALFSSRREVSVLVIDDDEETRDLLVEMIERAGYTTASARDGLEALAALHGIQPQLILLDIQMPVMNGAEFREAQRRNAELIRIPTVVMTGSKEEPILDVGVAEAIGKPFRIADLLAIIDRFCERADRER